MLQIALIPTLGLLMLMGLTVWVQSRRATKVAALRRSVEKKARSIVQRDAVNDQELVENIIRGMGIDQALQQFQNTRNALFPGGQVQDSTHWSAEQLEAWKSKSLRRGIESINRGLMLPAILSFLVVVSICVVATAVLYQFESSGQTASASPAVSVPALAPVPFDHTPLPPVMQPPPVPAEPVDSDRDAQPAATSPAPDELPDSTAPSTDPLSPDTEELSA
ncbi:MAG: hypothetical protein KDA75_19725 [Planctomycetaceae bacterium]|nr:hypothetical protein [Planctomycetaceae bacterium]MCA9076709.1 hypothetical protein [Planctomycetaceae bacterium]